MDCGEREGRVRGSGLSEVRCRGGGRERTQGKRLDDGSPREDDRTVPQAEVGWKLHCRSSSPGGWGGGAVSEAWGLWREAHRAGVPGQVGDGTQTEVKEGAHQHGHQQKGRHIAPQPAVDGEDGAAQYDNQVCEEPGREGREVSEGPAGPCPALGAGSART